MKRYGFFLVLVVLSLTALPHIYAADLLQSQVILESVKPQFGPSEEGMFKLDITNNGKARRDYAIYSPFTDIDWSVETRPVSDRVISLGPGETKSIEIAVYPTSTVSAGAYVLPLVISSEGQRKTLELRILFGPFEERKYLPSIRVGLNLPDNINVTQPFTVQAALENLNLMNYSDLTIKIKSEIEEFNARQNITLTPFDEEVVEFTLIPNKYLQPKDYFLFLIIEYDGESVKVEEAKISVLPHVIPFTQRIHEERRFLLSEKEITVINEGNLRNDQQISYKLNIFEKLITRTIPPAESQKGAFAWMVRLGPQEQATVHISTSYRVPVVLAVLALVLGILAMVFKAPAELHKSIKQVVMHEGGVSSVKVVLHVKNVGKTALTDIEIVDLLPHLSEIVKDADQGTLVPTKITRSSEGMYVKWHLSELEPFEERLINYHIASKLNIVGTFQLSRAKVMFRTKSGKQRVVYSNTVTVAP